MTASGKSLREDTRKTFMTAETFFKCALPLFCEVQIRRCRIVYNPGSYNTVFDNRNGNCKIGNSVDKVKHTVQRRDQKMRCIGLGLTVGYDGISRLAFLKLRTQAF